MRTVDLWKKRQDLANLLLKATGDSTSYSEIEALSAQYVEASLAFGMAMEEGDAWRDMFPLSTPAEIAAIVAAYRDEHPRAMRAEIEALRLKAEARDARMRYNAGKRKHAPGTPEIAALWKAFEDAAKRASPGAAWPTE